MFISAQFVVLLGAFALASASALALVSTGASRYQLARTAGEPQRPLTVAWVVSGIWGLIVLGLAIAIPLGVVGYGVLQAAMNGFGGGGGGD